ncbi:DUF362 domain-containing protein [Desulfovirgula thermocuniculi]|uniref:DUF362 domain-containing protein n=1 Tax=Desulfovirgula thermocuniculi TaxID=348842 RepID=UPI00042888E1|nr:DUF362 domain-containing protein [Desulfovirgula thermocuniculi]
MDRREFLRLCGLGVLAALGLAGCRLPRPSGEKAAPQTPAPYTPPPMQAAPARGPDLAVVEGDNYEELLEKGLEAMGGIARFVQKGNLVVLKPNFSVPRAPEEACTTSPRLVAALVKKCLEAGAREVRVIDHPFFNGETCLEKTGMRRAVREAGGKVYVLDALNDRYYTRVEIGGQALREVHFSRDVLEADVFINMPILKHHVATKLTMGLKNMMGLVWDRGVFHARGLHRPIAELAAFKKPHLIVMDAVRGITSNGPTGPGPIREFRRLILGTDPVAVDAYGARLFGLDPAEIEHLRLAAGMGLGQMDLSKLHTVNVFL